MLNSSYRFVLELYVWNLKSKLYPRHHIMIDNYMLSK